MGTCQNLCQQNSLRDNELKTINQKARKQTKEINQVIDESILDESECEGNAPAFVIQKSVNSSLSVRENRFMSDMEEEVKKKIKQIQQEQQLEIEHMKQKFLEQQQQQQKKATEQEQVRQLDQHLEEIKKKQKEDFEREFGQSISFNPNTQNQQSNPFLPMLKSGFAPKKDSDTVSQKSMRSPKVSKETFRKLQTMKEEIKSNNASNGSQKSKMQLKALEKMISEVASSDGRRGGSVKSILKQRSLSSRSMSKKSLKSTHTAYKPRKKKVRFTNDTNFENERKSVKSVKKKKWYEF